MHTHGEGGADDPRTSGPETWYQSLVEKVLAVLYMDASGEASPALYINPRGESLLGYSEDEWLEDPDSWVKTLHAEDREHVFAAHLRVREEDTPFEAEYRLIARGGSVVWVRDEAASVGDRGEGPGRRAGVLLDITDRKRYEEELERSEERFRLVAGVTGEAIWDNDLLTGVQEWDGATEALFGYPPDVGRTGAWWEERIHPDDRERVLSGLAAMLGDGGESWEEEYRFRRADGSYASVLRRYVRKDGSRVWVNLSVSLVRASSGEPEYLVCVAEDITERKLKELVPDPLTPKEMAVLRLASEGLSNPRIAGRLAYSVHAIKLHMRCIYTKLKLEVRTRREAVARAVDIGLIKPHR